MSSLPTPFRIGVKEFTTDQKDELGDAVEDWLPARDLWVHGIQPGAMQEPGDPARNASLVMWSVMAPAGSVVGDRDKVVLPGLGEYDVIGHVKDYTMGPWENPVAGVVIEVGRVDG